MKNKTVGIIGGAGGMGRWLADLLLQEGCMVHVTGRKTKMTAADAAKVCDVIAVSVPIAATAGVIAEVGPLLRKEQILMDLTSLKKVPVRQMLYHSVSEVVGCHPLFGPGTTDAHDRNIVLCPGRGEAGYAWIKSIFEKDGYTLLECTPEDHDRMMSVVQVLSHVNTMSLGMALAATGIPLEEVSRFATPMFRNKMEMVRKVMKESPDMYADIIAGNPDAERMLTVYRQVVEDIQALVSSGDVSRFKKFVTAAAGKLF